MQLTVFEGSGEAVVSEKHHTPSMNRSQKMLPNYMAAHTTGFDQKWLWLMLLYSINNPKLKHKRQSLICIPSRSASPVIRNCFSRVHNRRGTFRSSYSESSARIKKKKDGQNVCSAGVNAAEASWKKSFKNLRLSVASLVLVWNLVTSWQRRLRLMILPHQWSVFVFADWLSSAQGQQKGLWLTRRGRFSACFYLIHP